MEMMSFQHVLENEILPEERRLFHHCSVRREEDHAELSGDMDRLSSANKFPSLPSFFLLSHTATTNTIVRAHAIILRLPCNITADRSLYLMQIVTRTFNL